MINQLKQKNIEVSIIIPIYNEEDNIKLILNEVMNVCKKENRSYEIICINDGSTDNSLKIINEIAKKNQKIKVIDFIKNYGQTASMSAAIKYSSGNYIVALDADLQNDPNDIPILLKKLEEGFDCVSGWRHKRNDGFLRTFFSKVANSFVAFATDIELNDFGCTLKAYRSEILKKIDLYGDMHRFIPVYLVRLGARYTEIKVNHRPRRYGKSKYGMGRMPIVFLDIILLWFLVKAANRPMQFYGKIGLLTLFISVAFAVYTIYLKIFSKASFITTPLTLLVPLFFIGGLIFIMIGLLSEIQIRIYRQNTVTKEEIYIIKDYKNF